MLNGKKTQTGWLNGTQQSIHLITMQKHAYLSNLLLIIHYANVTFKCSFNAIASFSVTYALLVFAHACQGAANL